MNPQSSVAVQNAINRRAGAGMQTPQLSQVSPGTPMASGTPGESLPQSAMTKSSAMPAQKKTGSLSYSPQNSNEQIITALIETLKGNSSLEKEKLKLASGSIQPPTSNVPQFNQQPPQDSGNAFGAPSMAVSQQQGSSPFSQSPF